MLVSDVRLILYFQLQQWTNLKSIAAFTSSSKCKCTLQMFMYFIAGIPVFLRIVENYESYYPQHIHKAFMINGNLNGLYS